MLVIAVQLPKFGVKLVPTIPCAGRTNSAGRWKPGLFENSTWYLNAHVELQVNVGLDRSEPPRDDPPTWNEDPSAGVSGTMVHSPPQPGIASCRHPLSGLHVSAVHALLSSHVTDAPPWQLPPPQVSPEVQAFPSLQAAVLFV
jgi:hypothetical protein